MNVSAEASYEIVIGGYDNTLSDIRKGAHGSILVQANTPNILRCDEFLPFWIKWENSELSVGSGSLGSNIFMHYSEANMPNNFVATVASWTTSSVEYHFLESQGETCYLSPALFATALRNGKKNPSPHYSLAIYSVSI